MVRQAFLQNRRDYNLISQFSNLKLDIFKIAGNKRSWQKH